MLRQGLGEQSEFAGYHPAVNLIYFILVIGLTMFCLTPGFLAVTFAGAWIYSLMLRGTACLKMNLWLSVVMLALMVVINLLFNNNGATVLLYLNHSRVTLESAVYGAASGIMLVSVVIWFSCFQVILTSDKLIYLFGKVAPVLGLTLSMIFRFIPLLQSRFAEITLGQRCMRRSHSSGSLLQRARQLTKELSILIAWSLEASIESADSMEARGYGLRGRTSFHLFRWTRRDAAALCVMAGVSVPVVALMITGRARMSFYPRLVWPEMDAAQVLMLVCFGVLTATPMILDLAGERKWRQFDWNM